MAEPLIIKDQPAAADRLRQALRTFQGGQDMLLRAHRQVKNLPAREVETFWAGPGARLLAEGVLECEDAEDIFAGAYGCPMPAYGFWVDRWPPSLAVLRELPA